MGKFSCQSFPSWRRFRVLLTLLSADCSDMNGSSRKLHPVMATIVECCLNECRY